MVGLVTQDEVGARVWPTKNSGSRQNKVTRLESGDGGITPADLDRLLEMYGLTDSAEIDILRELNAGAPQRGRWAGGPAAQAGNERKFVDLIADAVAIQETAFEVIPALLQCDAYMRALQDAPATDAETAAQRAQQELVLNKNSTQYYVMLSESCVRRVRGDDAVMREQIEHLLTLSARPNIHLHLIPFHATAHGTALFERFSLLTLACPRILEDFTEYVELPYGRLAGGPVYAPTRKDAFQRIWLQAVNAAEDPARTRRHLRKIARELY